MTNEKIDRAEMHAKMIEEEFRKNVPGGDPAKLLEVIAEVHAGTLTLEAGLRALSFPGETR